MTRYVYIAQSLDGFIADRDGNLDWLTAIPNPDDSDLGFSEFMERVDAVVMGRNTFETVLGFGMWPYTKPVFVVSATLMEIPPEYSGKAEILNLKLSQIIEKLAKEGLNDLYIDGGALIQSFLAEDLIDELIITTIPILLGGGVPLFGALRDPVQFEHQSTRVLLGSLVKSHYRRER